LIIDRGLLLLNVVCIVSQAFEALLVAVRPLNCFACWFLILAVGFGNHKVNLLFGYQMTWFFVQELLDFPVLYFIQYSLQQLLKIILAHDCL
jgi:hypothetical protein